jgi:hypothetical protein
MGLFDSRYLPVTVAQYKQIYDTASFRLKQWRSHAYDCDDFAMAMKNEIANWGYNNISSSSSTNPQNNYRMAALGIVMVGFNYSKNTGHCWNLMVDYNGRVAYFEPQTGKFNPQLPIDYPDNQWVLF